MIRPNCASRATSTITFPNYAWKSVDFVEVKLLVLQIITYCNRLTCCTSASKADKKK